MWLERPAVHICATHQSTHKVTDDVWHDYVLRLVTYLDANLQGRFTGQHIQLSFKLVQYCLIGLKQKVHCATACTRQLI